VIVILKLGCLFAVAIIAWSLLTARDLDRTRE